MPGCKHWKKSENLTPTELEAIRHYATTGCSSTELRAMYGLTVSKANKVIYYGFEEMKAIARNRKALDNIEQAGIENELVTINNYINEGEQTATD